METASEVRRARSGSVPGTRDTSDHEVSISLNSAFVTNIALCPRTRTPPDLSPFMRRRLQLEAEERRLAPQGEAGGQAQDTQQLGQGLEARGHDMGGTLTGRRDMVM